MNTNTVHRKLDEASKGLLSSLEGACKNLKLKPYVMVQTEGLPRGQMRLVAIGIDNDGRTRFFETAKLPKDVQGEGWELKAALALKEGN